MRLAWHDVQMNAEDRNRGPAAQECGLKARGQDGTCFQFFEPQEGSVPFRSPAACVPERETSEDVAHGISFGGNERAGLGGGSVCKFSTRSAGSTTAPGPRQSRR